MTRTCLALVASCALAAGCDAKPKGTSDPEAKLRLERFLELYKLCSADAKKPPAGEQAFRGFLGKLTPEQKANYKLDDIDALFVSPTDGQKYTVRYGTALDPSGATRKLAWETAGADGRRYVALTMGYVERYGEASFKDLK